MDDLFLPVTTVTLARAAAMYLGFVGFMFLLARFVPGRVHQGLSTRAGKRLDYRLNGLVLFLFVPPLVVGVAVQLGGSLTVILAHFWPLFIVANAFAFALSFWLLARGRRRAKSGDGDAESKGALRDLWMGVELNPRLFGVDLKMFSYQPTLIGMFIVVLAFAFRQHELYGTVTPQMVLLVAFYWLYLFTHYVRESFMLSTWDIIAERFGLMLVWGDYVYVPFFYSIVGWWAIDDLSVWPWWALASLVLLHLFGHYLFRSANWQKDSFKRDRKARIWGREAETLDGRLLVSGWWGIGRHLNYSGEIIVYTTFALCTSGTSVIPFILPVSLLVLLTQRAHRDDKRCRAKYGELWERYCARVRWCMVPGIY